MGRNGCEVCMPNVQLFPFCDISCCSLILNYSCKDLGNIPMLIEWKPGNRRENLILLYKSMTWLCWRSMLETRHFCEEKTVCVDDQDAVLLAKNFVFVFVVF